MKNSNKFSLIILLSFWSCSYCDFIENQNSKEFFGIVYEKKVYDWDRGKKVLTILKNSKKENYYFPTDYVYNEFWSKINVGDSIFKGENSKAFKVFRKGILIRQMELDFNCSNYD